MAWVTAVGLIPFPGLATSTWQERRGEERRGKERKEKRKNVASSLVETVGGPVRVVSDRCFILLYFLDIFKYPRRTRVKALQYSGPLGAKLGDHGLGIKPSQVCNCPSGP